MSNNEMRIKLHSATAIWSFHSYLLFPLAATQPNHLQSAHATHTKALFRLGSVQMQPVKIGRLVGPKASAAKLREFYRFSFCCLNLCVCVCVGSGFFFSRCCLHPLNVGWCKWKMEKLWPLCRAKSNWNMKKRDAVVTRQRRCTKKRL